MRQTFPLLRAFLFDLDGTLIDSKLDLVTSVNAMLCQMGRADSCGNRGDLHRPRCASTDRHALAPGPPTTNSALDSPVSRALSTAQAGCHAARYPGVVEALDALAAYPMSVLTNKPTNMSVDILQGLGLAKYFRSIYGGDSFEKKKPIHRRSQILQELGVSPLKPPWLAIPKWTRRPPAMPARLPWPSTTDSCPRTAPRIPPTSISTPSPIWLA